MPHAKGTQHGSNKLKVSEVLDIRESNKLAKVLAIDYGVHISLIYRIRNNEYWKHI